MGGCCSAGSQGSASPDGKYKRLGNATKVRYSKGQDVSLGAANEDWESPKPSPDLYRKQAKVQDAALRMRVGVQSSAGPTLLQMSNTEDLDKTDDSPEIKVKPALQRKGAVRKHDDGDQAATPPVQQASSSPVQQASSSPAQQATSPPAQQATSPPARSARNRAAERYRREIAEAEKSHLSELGELPSAAPLDNSIATMVRNGIAPGTNVPVMIFVKPQQTTYDAATATPVVETKAMEADSNEVDLGRADDLSNGMNGTENGGVGVGESEPMASVTAVAANGPDHKQVRDVRSASRGSEASQRSGDSLPSFASSDIPVSGFTPPTMHRQMSETKSTPSARHHPRVKVAVEEPHKEADAVSCISEPGYGPGQVSERHMLDGFSIGELVLRIELTYSALNIEVLLLRDIKLPSLPRNTELYIKCYLQKGIAETSHHTKKRTKAVKVSELMAFDETLHFLVTPDLDVVKVMLWEEKLGRNPMYGVATIQLTHLGGNPEDIIQQPSYRYKKLLIKGTYPLFGAADDGKLGVHGLLAATSTGSLTSMRSSTSKLKPFRKK